MDNQKLGEVIGTGLAGNEQLHAENWLPVFDNQELLAEVQDRITKGKLAADELAIIAVWGASQVGPVAAANQVQSQETSFEEKLEQFLDPKAEVSVAEQLEVMKDFWGKLGFKVPELNETQQAKLAETVAKHPGKRVVPTVLGIGWRPANANRARQVFPRQQFRDSGEALWIPGPTDSLYGQLLSDPDNTVKQGRTSYGLRYKNLTGDIVDREAFAEDLSRNHHSIKEPEQGTVWTFPVMDVAVQSERTYDTAANLHKKVSPIVTPDTLITMQLLHQANGTPNPRWHVDFANEAVYELDKKGDPKALVQVASVNWFPYDRQVNSYAWLAVRQSGNFGVRGAESGLKT